MLRYLCYFRHYYHEREEKKFFFRNVNKQLLSDLVSNLIERSTVNGRKLRKGEKEEEEEEEEDFFNAVFLLKWATISNCLKEISFPDFTVDPSN